MESTSKYTSSSDHAHENAVGTPIVQNIHQETQCDSVFPINALAPETIGEIFFWVVYDATPVHQITSWDSGCEEGRMIPVLLRICRKWRMIALNKPQLFTRLIFLEAPRVDPLVTIPRWLALSGKLSLDIAVYPYRWKKHYGKLGDWEIAMKKIFEGLSQAVSRCKSLAMLSAAECMSFLIPDGTRIHAPILEILDLQYFPPSPRVLMGVLVCPALRRLHVGKFWPQLHVTNANPVSSLSYGTEPTLRRVVEFLQQASFLEECEFDDLQPEEGDDFPLISTISLLNLNRLVISWDPSDSPSHAEMSRFLQALRIPQIETFVLHNQAVITNNTLIGDAICAIFASIPGVILLRKLTLRGINISTEDLLPSLSRMPHLEFLRIESNVISDTFLDALGYKDGVPYLFPKLQEVDFAYSTLSGIDVLVGMAKGRMEIVARERIPSFRLLLAYVPGITDGDIEFMDALEREYAGVLDVYISRDS
ncbi:hypothetical protein M422DRAFT_25382 [Sphaerobolus stellatus SS14]|nr:hypothetical protein M422DRAFT_25382 [Sphaerobolus stellatus SS14]